MKILVVCIPIVSVLIAMFIPGVYVEDLIMRWTIPICLILTAILSVTAARNQKNSGSESTILLMTLLSQCAIIIFQIIFIFLEKPIEITNDVYTGIVVGGIMLILGNFMPRTKPNAAFGLRLPWTLTNEVVWRKSNHFAGCILMLAGILVICLSILLKENIEIVILSVVLCIVVIATLVSYSYHRKMLNES